MQRYMPSFCGIDCLRLCIRDSFLVRNMLTVLVSQLTRPLAGLRSIAILSGRESRLAF